MNSNFKFGYSISVNEYDRTKNEKETYKLRWKEREGTTTTLINDIKNNRAFCPCFLHNDDTFSNKDKSDSNLKSTNFIIYDMDAVKLTARNFYSLMVATEIPPTIVYTTANNGKFKEGKNEIYNNRYRVIYLLDAPIFNATFYKQIHQTLKSEICSTIDDKNIYNDNSDSSVSHFYAGNKNAEVYSGESVLSLAWLCDRYGISLSGNKKVSDGYITSANKKVQDRQIISHEQGNDDNENKGGRDRYIISHEDDVNKHGNYIQYLFNQRINKLNEGGRDRQIIKKEREHYMSIATTLDNSEFVRDYYNLSVKKIIEKYISAYPSIEFSQVEYDATQAYYMVPSDYIEIKRKWHYREIEKENGDTYRVTEIERCKNGQGRRRRLFLNLIIRRLIEPSLTFEHLLFNGVYELHHFIDNSDKDDIITKKEVAEIAINAYFEDIEKWSKLKNYHKPKYKVNKEWCNAHGVKPRQQAIKVRGELNRQAKEKKWLEVDHYYNPSLTNNGNIELLKANGIEIGLTALKEYKKSRGYTKSKSKDKQTTAKEPHRATQRENNTEMEQQPTATANGSQRDTQSKKNNHMAQQQTATANEPNNAVEGDYNNHMEQQPTATANEQQSANNSLMEQQPTATIKERQRATQSENNRAIEQQHTTTINGSHSASNEVTNGDVMTMEIVEAIVNELDHYYSDGAEIKEVKPHRYEVNLGNAILYPELANKVYNYLYEHGLNAGNLYMDRENDGKCCNTFTMWLG